MLASGWVFPIATQHADYFTHGLVATAGRTDGRTDRLQTDALCRIHAADDDATATQEDSFVVSGRVGMNLGITLSAYKFSVHV